VLEKISGLLLKLTARNHEGIGSRCGPKGNRKHDVAKYPSDRCWTSLTFVSSLLLTKRMPNTIPTTSYGWVVSDLRDLANDLDQIAYYIFA